MSPSLHPRFSSPARAPRGAIEGADEFRTVAVSGSLGMGRVGVAQGNDSESSETRGRMRPTGVKREVHAQSFFRCVWGKYTRRAFLSVRLGKYTRRAFLSVRLGEVHAQSSFSSVRRAEAY